MVFSLTRKLFLALTIALTLAFAPAGVTLIDELSSPEYEGRGMGTQGLEKARNRLVQEVERLKLQPPNESYTQEFQAFAGSVMVPPSEENPKPTNYFSSITAESAGFMPQSYSLSRNLGSRELVFVGYGITFLGEYDDYGVDVKDKIVIAMTGDPGIGNKDSLFRNPEHFFYSTALYKVQNAAQHGAVGIVLVQNPIELGGEEEPAFIFHSRGGSGAVFDIVSGRLSLDHANKLLETKKLEALQETINTTQKPQSFSLGKKATMGVRLIHQVGTVANVVALIPGTNPKLQTEYIVLGAHYDHLGYGEESSLEKDGKGKIHFGADDNASGVQMVINLAKKIANDKLQRPHLIALFSAEEVGLLGSQAFVNNPPVVEGGKVIAMFNFDMVGRMRENKLIVFGETSAHEFPEMGKKIRHSLTLSSNKNIWGSSDHASFLRAKIPALFFTTGPHDDYHRSTDTAEKINYEGMKKIEAFAYQYIKQVDAAQSPPTYNEEENFIDPAPQRGGRGYGAYFGSIPDFHTRGDDGVLLQGVKRDSPAEKAGLQKNDILVGIGEIKIRNLHEFVFALRFYRPNEKITVHWTRDGKAMSSETVLGTRSGGH